MPSTWPTPRVWTAGERVSASKMNEISTALGILFPHTTGGDLAYRDPAGAYLTRVAIGGAGAILNSTGSAPAWVSIGTVGQVLQSNGSAPVWVSGERYIPMYLNSDVALTTGDYQGWFPVPSGINGWNITSVLSMRSSGTGVPSFQLRRIRSGASVDVLSTQSTIDSGEVTSVTAATPAVINTANDDLATGDILATDVDASGTSTLRAVLVVGVTKP